MIEINFAYNAEASSFTTKSTEIPLRVWQNEAETIEFGSVQFNPATPLTFVLYNEGEVSELVAVSSPTITVQSATVLGVTVNSIRVPLATLTTEARSCRWALRETTGLKRVAVYGSWDCEAVPGIPLGGAS